MKNPIISYIHRILRKLGFEVRRLPQPTLGWLTPLSAEQPLSLDISGSESPPPGFAKWGRVEGPGVNLVCEPWQISHHTQNVQTIRSCNLLHFLTNTEARATLNSWYDALLIGGTIEISVPNLQQAIDSWSTTDWSAGETHEKHPAPSSPHFQIFGDSLPILPHESPQAAHYSTLQKSGYSPQRLACLLEKVGFVSVTIKEADAAKITVTGSKLTQKHERQVAPDLSGIRNDHLARYYLASSLIGPNACIGDYACGIGYGSYILAQNEKTQRILAGDIDPGAIQYASQYYHHSKVQHSITDLMASNSLPSEQFDMITSFETIEHVGEPEKILRGFFAALKPGGMLLCSTPNEEVIPLKEMNNPYHHKHYTPREFAHLLESCGFAILDRRTQCARDSLEMENGWHGIYNVAVCTKK